VDPHPKIFPLRSSPLFFHWFSFFALRPSRGIEYPYFSLLLSSVSLLPFFVLFFPHPILEFPLNPVQVPLFSGCRPDDITVTAGVVVSASMFPDHGRFLRSPPLQDMVVIPLWEVYVSPRVHKYPTAFLFSFYPRSAFIVAGLFSSPPPSLFVEVFLPPSTMLFFPELVSTASFQCPFSRYFSRNVSVL